jgi:predicted small metal-binding protein
MRRADDHSRKEETFMAMKFVKCDCGFVMRSDDDDKLVAEVQQHASAEHKMTLTRYQVLAMAQPEAGAPVARASHKR